jgi:hypothetical protein
MLYDTARMKRAGRIIANHYGLPSVTDEQTNQELISLFRKQANGNLDDGQMQMLCEITIALGLPPAESDHKQV